MGTNPPSSCAFPKPLPLLTPHHHVQLTLALAGFISDGRGLLHAHGISIGNNVDGDAVHAVVTMSRLRHPDPADTDAGELVKPEVALFLTDWAGVLHALLHTGRELLVELSEASCLSPAPWGCTSGRTASL